MIGQTRMYTQRLRERFNSANLLPPPRQVLVIIVLRVQVYSLQIGFPFLPHFGTFGVQIL